MKKSKNVISFLKTTALGGLLFLLPLIVIGALIGQAVPIVLAIYGFLKTYIIPAQTPGELGLLLLFSIALVLLMCFGAGLLARRSLGRRISQTFEKNLMLLFPRYAIFKEQMSGTIGGDAVTPQMQPILARFEDCTRIGFEVERSEQGRVTVYLPTAPDPWSGHVVLMNADRVEPLDVEFGKTLSIFERLGRESVMVLANDPK